MDVSVEGEEMEVLGSVPTLETSSNEQDRSQVVLKQCSMGKRLMIIKLGKYNEAEELHIETRTAGSQGHVCYQNGYWRVSVTRVTVHIGVEETGMQTGYRGAYKQAPSW